MKNLLHIGNRLSRHGYNLTSIETLGPLLEREGYHLTYASTQKNKVLRMLSMVGKTIIYGPKSDYVLIDTYSTANFWFAFAVSQICRLFGIRYIPKLHGGDLPNRLKNNPLLCRMIFKHSYLNVAPSGYLVQAFEAAGYPTMFIPNNIDICNYKFKLRKPLKPRLLWVRSFSPIYNPEMALAVFKELKQTYPDAELCMVGPDKNGYLEKVQKVQQELGIDVRFTGKLSKEEWTSLAAEYDIFINTTHFDNTPVSVLEAMALGLPVVSTNVGGIPYLLKDRHTALLVEDGAARKMTDRIKLLLENQELKDKLVSNALELVRTFDTERVKYQWFEILK